MTLSYQQENLSYLLNEVAGDILEQGAVVAPPVNAIELAKGLQIGVIIDSQQPTRARHKQIMQQHTIFLKPDDRPERMQWAAAHELGEVFAWRVFDQLNDTEESRPHSVQREEVANLLASRILLPDKHFFLDAIELQFDLIPLKAIYTTASYELIAMRLLDEPAQKIVTICDQGAITRRRSNMKQSLPSMRPLERECWQKGMQTGKRVTYQDAGLKVCCFPVHEPHWKREILLTTPIENEDFE